MFTLLVVFCWLYLAVLVHEAGHLLVAYWLDRPIASFVVGQGLRLREWYWRGIRCEICLWPWSGAVKQTARSKYRWKNIAFILAGPFANIMGWVVLQSIGAKDGATIFLILGAINLLPLRGFDGRQFWRELFRPIMKEI